MRGLSWAPVDILSPQSAHTSHPKHCWVPSSYTVFPTTCGRSAAAEVEMMNRSGAERLTIDHGSRQSRHDRARRPVRPTVDGAGSWARPASLRRCFVLDGSVDVRRDELRLLDVLYRQVHATRACIGIGKSAKKVHEVTIIRFRCAHCCWQKQNQKVDMGEWPHQGWKKFSRTLNSYVYVQSAGYRQNLPTAYKNVPKYSIFMIKKSNFLRRETHFSHLPRLHSLHKT